MAAPTERLRVLVVKKTKLGEADLILTFLAQDGSQRRAVAKGARKPSSPFAARLEVFSESDVLIARGRSLDIVKEARLAAGRPNLHGSVERAACAAPVAELLERISQPNLPVSRLFALSNAALDALDAAPAPACPMLCAAALLKAVSLCGFRPSFERCACCGAGHAADARAEVPFSVSEGGVLCAGCARGSDAQRVPAATLQWCRALLGSTFERIASFPVDQSAAFAALQLAGQWVRFHVGSGLKSLAFLSSSGLF